MLAVLAGVKNALFSIPTGAIGILHSPVRDARVLDPGLRLALPFVETIDVLDPYVHDSTLSMTTPQGVRFGVRVRFRFRPSAEGVTELLASTAGDPSPTLSRLGDSIDSVLLGALREGTLVSSVSESGPPPEALMAEALSPYGHVEGRVKLQFDESSPGGVVMKRAWALKEARARVRDTGLKVLLLGLDGADWQIAEPLIRSGRMPNLESLRRHGAWGRVRSLVPVLSPLLWTSVVTGVTADKHGILDFLVPVSGGQRRAPVSSTFRRAPALWNFFTDFGLTVDVVAWWATWPAEVVSGRMISDRVSYSLFDVVAPEGCAGMTHPSEFCQDLRPLIVRGEDISHADIARFAGITPEELAATRSLAANDPRAAYREPLNHLTKILASTRTYHRIALELLRTRQAHLTAVYYQGIDEVSHRFMHFAPPVMPGIDPADVRRYGAVVERFYEYQDELLGELLRAIDPRTVVIVVSDHGFINGTDRIPGKSADIEGQPARWHRPHGILVLNGGPCARATLPTSSLLDIAPTVMHLAGLPVPEFFPGRVIEEAFEPSFLKDFPRLTVSAEEMPPFAGALAPSTASLGAVDNEMIENLRSLGYVGSDLPASGTTGDESASQDEQTPSGTRPALVTTHTNLAGVHLSAGRLAEAETEITKALLLAPTFDTALFQLFDLRMKQGRYDEAIDAGKKLLGGVDPDNVHFLARLATAYREAGRTDEGIEEFRRDFERGHPGVGIPLARLLRERGALSEAGRVARAVLSQDALNEGAMATLFQIAQDIGKPDSVMPFLERALDRQPRSVMHLNWMAILLEQTGKAPEAEDMLFQALDVHPDHPATIANLGAFHLHRGRAAEAITLLQRSLRFNPSSVEVRVNLGTALATVGRLSEAIVEFEAVLSAGYRQPPILNALARAYGQRGDLMKAEKLLEESLQMAPSQPDVRNLLAEVKAAIHKRG